jgi:hypothetical protein
LKPLDIELISENDRENITIYAKMPKEAALIFE